MLLCIVTSDAPVSIYPVFGRSSVLLFFEIRFSGGFRFCYIRSRFQKYGFGLNLHCFPKAKINVFLKKILTHWPQSVLYSEEFFLEKMVIMQPPKNTIFIALFLHF